MRFTHAADLYTGSSLSKRRNAPDGEAKGFATARKGVFRTLDGHALANESSFIVLADDIFDGGWAGHANEMSSLTCLADLSRNARAPLTAVQRLGQLSGLV